MSEIAIRAEDLGKRYVIGGARPRYRTLRDHIGEMASAPLRMFRRRGNGNGEPGASATEDFWALRNVSFEIKRGEVVGIVGRNGAGKSTLLKILSRITEPTEGLADIHGRIGSLLEVGTGFHPELTGRENVFLNGAILGMKRAEIEHSFDEIVAFAEVEKFIDTPVKHYSSGMYLRLAFAVAAHLEPEILLVDEVLAVGDTLFQKKCLGKMEDVARQGRTVLFVSHNMGAVRTLCNRGIFLHDGRLIEASDINHCVTRYYESIGALESPSRNGASKPRSGTGFANVSIRVGGVPARNIPQAEAFEAHTVLHLDEEASGFSVYCIIEDMQGRTVCHMRTDSKALESRELPAGEHEIGVTFPPLWLNPGLYALHFKIGLWGQTQAQRFVSDKFPLGVEGECSSSDAILNPCVTWTMQRN